jgi:hypothetical protein
LSLHYFRIIIKRGCETMVHDIQAVVDVHPDSVVLQVDIVNAFNIISLRIIFQKMCVSGG